MPIDKNKKYRIKGNSRYFERKYGSCNPEALVEKPCDYHHEYNPAGFLYIGRMLAEDLPTDGNTWYVHVKGLGEIVHEAELEEVEEA